MVDTAYLAFMARRQCLVEAMAPKFAVECLGRLTIHHLREYGSPKNDRRTVPLCEAHHLIQAGPFAIERGKRKFIERTGIDLEAAIGGYNLQFEKEGKKP